MLPRRPDDLPYRPTSKRQRLVILTVAIGMAVAVMVVVLSPHVRFLRADKARQMQDRPACSAGQTTDCVGGTMGVINSPAPAGTGSR